MAYKNKSDSDLVWRIKSESKIYICYNSYDINFQGVQVIFPGSEERKVPVHLQGVPTDLSMDQKRVRHGLQVDQKMLTNIHQSSISISKKFEELRLKQMLVKLFKRKIWFNGNA